MKKLLLILTALVAFLAVASSAQARLIYAKVNNASGSACGSSCQLVTYNSTNGATHISQVAPYTATISGTMCTPQYCGLVSGSHVWNVIDNWTPPWGSAFNLTSWARQPCGAGWRYSAETRVYTMTYLDGYDWWIGNFNVNSVCGASALSAFGPTKLAAALTG